MKNGKREKGFLEKIFESQDVYDAIKSTYIASGLLGIFPLQMVKTNGKYRMTIQKLFLIITLAYFVTSLYSLYSVGNDEETIMETLNNTLFFTYGDRFMMYLGFAFAYLLVILSFYKRQTNVLILELMNDADEILLSLGMEKNYTKINQRLAVHLVIQQLISFLGIVVNVMTTYYVKKQPSYSILVSSSAPSYVILFNSTLYTSLVKLFNYTHQAINCQLNALCRDKKALKTSNSKNCDMFKWIFVPRHHFYAGEKTLERLTQIWKLYDRMCDCCDAINSIYSPKLLCTFMYGFLSITFNSFFAMNALFWLLNSKTPIGIFTFLIMCVNFIVLHMVQIGNTIKQCNQTKIMVILLFYTIVCLI